MIRPHLAARAGRWAATHRKAAIGGWLLFVVLAVVAGQLAGFRGADDADTGVGESGRADRAIAETLRDRPSESVLVQSATHRAGDPAFTATVRDVRRRVAATPGATRVRLAAVSADRRSALVTFELPEEGRAGPSLAATRAAERAHPGFQVAQFGDRSFEAAMDETVGRDFANAEKLSLPLTLVILLVAFGSVVAAGLPLLLAMSAVGASLGIVAVATALVPMEETVSSVVLLIGLAVGVDYSLFYLRREREERAAGRGPEAALEAAAATSGHAVLVSGLTVMIAMAGMFIAGQATFTGIAIGAIVVVGVAVLASLSVLPAVLSLLGDRVERGRIPLLGRRRAGDPRIWGAVLRVVLRRPAVSLALGVGVLVALTLPALGLKTIMPGIESVPQDLPAVAAHDRIEAAFPGNGAPATVVVRAADVRSAPVRDGIAAMRREGVRTGVLREPADVRVSGDGRLAAVTMAMPGEGTDARSNAALGVLRSQVIPRTLDRVPGVRADVTGETAGAKDFRDRMGARAPVVAAFVLGLAFLLLLVTFRSLVIPLKAIALNLLSVGAAYGVLVLVFQHGWGAGLVGLDRVPGGVTAWLPVFLFVVLFGLSMDYHVFIVNRVRELRDAGLPTTEAVARGIRSTAGVVTSAAAIMVGVFSVFATLSGLEFKQMGVGLAVAILLDATLVRGVVLPGAMALLGERCWWLPGVHPRRRERRPVAV